MCDPKIAEKNRNIWLAQQAAMQYTPSEPAEQRRQHRVYPMLLSSVNRHPHREKAHEKPEIAGCDWRDSGEDMLELKRDSAAAVENRRRSMSGSKD